MDKENIRGRFGRPGPSVFELAQPRGGHGRRRFGDLSGAGCRLVLDDMVVREIPFVVDLKDLTCMYIDMRSDGACPMWLSSRYPRVSFQDGKTRRFALMEL